MNEDEANKNTLKEAASKQILQHWKEEKGCRGEQGRWRGGRRTGRWMLVVIGGLKELDFW